MQRSHNPYTYIRELPNLISISPPTDVNAVPDDRKFALQPAQSAQATAQRIGHDAT